MKRNFKPFFTEVKLMLAIEPNRRIIVRGNMSVDLQPSLTVPEASAEVAAAELKDNYVQFALGKRPEFVAHFPLCGQGMNLEHHEQTYLNLLIGIGGVFDIDAGHWRTPEGVIINETAMTDTAGNVGHVILSATLPQLSAGEPQVV